ncbi:heme oxygenase (staphylobilin-producing) [Priestia aryabhattai B8W22]|uniref:antibiotic biosynthesis monooxygenase family protein n=1 Tax=Priestia aryabhattai TaxID=412384 RepID=UPI00088CBB27|nr:heme oxygenase (staphylobilin-producing) [Priestia aryabhattai B8W22]
MFVQLRRLTVTEGNSDQVVDRFSKAGIIEEQEGFVDLKVLLKQVRRGEEEVIILVTWESEDYWKQWEKSDAHIAGHKAKCNQSKPEYIINTEVGKYEVRAIKKAVGNNHK